MTASIPNGNVRRRTSSCRCVGRLKSLMLCFKQANFQPTTITCQQEQVSDLLVIQKAPSGPVGGQSLSSRSLYCRYSQSLICPSGGFRTWCIWPEVDATADEAIGLSSLFAPWPVVQKRRSDFETKSNCVQDVRTHDEQDCGCRHQMVLPNQPNCGCRATRTERGVTCRFMILRGRCGLSSRLPGLDGSSRFASDGCINANASRSLSFIEAPEVVAGLATRSATIAACA